MPASLKFAAALLPLWGFPAGAGIAPADEQGTNNRTFLVRHGQQRYVLRVSGFLSVAEVRAEHLILLQLRQGGLPFQVPEPVTAPDGQTVIATPAGPAAVCRWLPGVRLGMDGEPSVLTYLLEPIAGGTRLTVRHAGIAAPEQRNNVSAGWRTSCDRLSEILPTQKR